MREDERATGIRKRVPKGRAKGRVFSIVISCWGFVLVGSYLIGEILEAGSLTDALQYFTQPSLFVPHSMLLLTIPAFMLIGYFYQRQQNLAENLEQLVEERASRLRESQTRLKNMFDASPDAITLSDLNGNIIECNQATLDMQGVSSKEGLIGKSGFEFIARKDRPRAMEQLKKILEQGSAKNMRYTCLTRDGREFVGEQSVSVIKDSSGNPTGLVAITKDITERKKAEEALRESEERLGQLIEYAPDAIYVNDLKGNFIDGNKQAENLVGYKKDELIGRNFLKVGLLPKRYVPKAAKALMKNLLGQRTGPDEFELIRKDGRRVTVEISTFPVKRGGKVEVIGIARDITERKQAEDALRESEEKHRTLVESVPDAVFIHDRNGRYLYINSAGARFLGKEPVDIIGRELTEIFPEEIAKEMFKDVLHIFRKNRIAQQEVVVPLDEELRYFSRVMAPICDGKGAVVSVIGVAHDVTERKRMEEELRRYSDRLGELVEERTRELKESQERLLKSERLAAIGETAAMVGHDLRNPLQAIVNTFYLVNLKLESMPITDRKILEKHGFLELRRTLVEQVEYMNRTISDLRDYARPLEPELVETSLHQLINEALSAITVPENVKVSTVVEKDLDFPKLMVDPTLMKRVFVNLVTNALQAMPDGGQLTIRASKKEETAFISVQDTGVGIPEENLDKIFTPLFTTKPKGQGFGLPVCKRVVEAHNGAITVESEVGRGSAFTVEIPLRREVS